jgi:hypothetical protein
MIYAYNILVEEREEKILLEKSRSRWEIPLNVTYRNMT